MKKKDTSSLRPVPTGHVVRDFYINNGHTHVKICDDYVVKTQEEVDAIIGRISEMAQRALTAKYLQEQQQNNI